MMRFFCVVCFRAAAWDVGRKGPSRVEGGAQWGGPVVRSLVGCRGEGEGKKARRIAVLVCDRHSGVQIREDSGVRYNTHQCQWGTVQYTHTFLAPQCPLNAASTCVGEALVPYDTRVAPYDTHLGGHTHSRRLMIRGSRLV